MRHTKINIGGMDVGDEFQSDFPMADRGDLCSGIVVSHGVEIAQGHRGKGYGQRAHIARLERFRDEGYNYALCTVRRDNKAQVHILEKNGWVKLANTATDNGTPVYLFGKNLR